MGNLQSHHDELPQLEGGFLEIFIEAKADERHEKLELNLKNEKTLK